MEFEFDTQGVAFDSLKEGVLFKDHSGFILIKTEQINPGFRGNINCVLIVGDAFHPPGGYAMARYNEIVYRVTEVTP